MHRLLALLFVAAVSSTPAWAQFAQHETLALRAATPAAASVGCYGKFELALDLKADYENPFDPEQVVVYTLLTAPGGRLYRVNGFLDQPFTRKLEGKAEKIESAGPLAWKVRFTPPATGHWTYQVFAQDHSGQVQLPKASFEVTASARPGFIKRSLANPRAFAWDSGAPCYLVGENVCWGGGRGSFDYDDWLPKLSASGGNWIRIWMSSWNCALEWGQESKGDWRSGQYYGVGVYSLGNAWKLDQILDTAEREGLSVMLCFGTYGEFNEGGYFNEGQWKANPYNASNGGPCAQPADFWSDATARHLYQRRLRYILARYAWRTCIQSWEFWNEAQAPAAWVAEMARAIKGTGEFTNRPLDPQGHLLSTTYGNPDVWEIPEIDFTQTHSYGKADLPDHAPKLHQNSQQHYRFNKPHLVSEFGIDWRAPDTKYDAQGQGINLHNALWASTLSGDAGTAMIWWWDSYVHPSNLYPHFKPIRAFADKVQWTAGEWKPLEARALLLQVYALGQGRSAIFWAHNPESHWKNAFDKKAVAPAPSEEITLSKLPSGRYGVEWWNTWKGTVSAVEHVECKDQTMTIRVPELDTDIAARLFPE